MSLTRYPSVGFSEATVAAINTGIYVRKRSKDVALHPLLFITKTQLAEGWISRVECWPAWR